jgi:hypothetical protein
MLDKMHLLFHPESRDQHPVSHDILYQSVLKKLIYQDFGSGLSGLDFKTPRCQLPSNTLSLSLILQSPCLSGYILFLAI